MPLVFGTDNPRPVELDPELVVQQKCSYRVASADAAPHEDLEVTLPRRTLAHEPLDLLDPPGVRGPGIQVLEPFRHYGVVVGVVLDFAGLLGQTVVIPLTGKRLARQAASADVWVPLVDLTRLAVVKNAWPTPTDDRRIHIEDVLRCCPATIDDEVLSESIALGTTHADEEDVQHLGNPNGD